MTTPSPALDPPCVAVIDDDEQVRAGLENLLASAGIAACAHGSAEAFLAARGWEAASMLLLDVRMPGISGLDLQQRLTAAGIALPVVVLSAHCDQETRDRALRQGAVGFLCKPCDEDELLAMIDRALGR